MKKHAYIIVANSITKVITTCVEMIDDPLNDIFILFDKKSKLISVADSLKQVVNYSHISFFEQIVNWGGYSQIDAVMTHLETVAKEEEYSYIHFFQRADLPIKSKKQIRAFFDRNEGSEFVSVEFGRKKMADNKCHYYHFFCHNRFLEKIGLLKQ